MQAGSPAGTVSLANHPATAREYAKEIAEMASKNPAPMQLAPVRALLDERARLLGNTRELELDAQHLADVRRFEGDDPVDIATDLMEREMLGTLGRNSRGRIAEIDDALTRLHADSYGRCEECERPIDPERLLALPHARRCLKCQRWTERARFRESEPSAQRAGGLA
jgi:DnaK suppressor protein